MSHSILDIPYLAVAALLAIGGLPSLRTIALGLVAAFAGLTAIFGLNDMLDRNVDAQKMKDLIGKPVAFDLDSLGFRHPVAQGKLSFEAGLAWVIFWSVLSFVTAWLVRPVCAVLLVAAAGLEAAYCGLLRVTPLKTVLSGCNVAVGGLAGLYAVALAPSPGLVLLYFLWALSWEMGCRNMPNDWVDYNEDVALGIKTIAVRFGLSRAARISFATMTITVISTALFPVMSPIPHWPLYELVSLGAAACLLVIPSIAWLMDLRRTSALVFFNRACFYPLAVFAALGLAMAV